MTPHAGVRTTGEVGDLADRIAQAVRGCPDVAAPARGPVGTYLPGRAVTGVAVRDTRVEVAVVARYGRPLTEIADQVRAAVEPVVPGLPVDVRIDDLEIPGEAPDRPAAGAGEGREGRRRRRGTAGDDSTADDSSGR